MGRVGVFSSEPATALPSLTRRARSFMRCVFAHARQNRFLAALFKVLDVIMQYLTSMLVEYSTSMLVEYLTSMLVEYFTSMLVEYLTSMLVEFPMSMLASLSSGRQGDKHLVSPNLNQIVW